MIGFEQDLLKRIHREIPRIGVHNPYTGGTPECTLTTTGEQGYYQAWCTQSVYTAYTLTRTGGQGYCPAPGVHTPYTGGTPDILLSTNLCPGERPTRVPSNPVVSTYIDG